MGTIEPLAEIAQVCRKHRVLLHSDGTAAVGRAPVDIKKLGCDSYSFAAQSFYGPKGAAALYLRTGLKLQPLIEGGVQERSRRAGTENVPAIVGMGKAAELARQNTSRWSESMTRLSRRLLAELPKRLEHIILTGHPENRLPGHVSLCVEFVEGEGMLLFLDDEGIAAASGSACTAKTLKASHVLLALGLSHAIAQSSLMLTMGKDTTDEDVDYFLVKLPPIVERLRKMSPLYAKLLKGEDPYETRNDQSPIPNTR
jgi:cysteine desulfurase